MLYLDILDYVPRYLTILYLEIVDSTHKQVGGCLQNLCQSGSYSPELRTFGTLITSTKVFSLIIICDNLMILYLEILDFVPRDLTILYLEIVDAIHNNRSLIQV